MVKCADCEKEARANHLLCERCNDEMHYAEAKVEAEKERLANLD